MRYLEIDNCCAEQIFIFFSASLLCNLRESTPEVTFYPLNFTELFSTRWTMNYVGGWLENLSTSKAADIICKHSPASTPKSTREKEGGFEKAEMSDN